jgi:hypothetical protein
MKVITETYLMKIITETYLMKVITKRVVRINIDIYFFIDVWKLISNSDNSLIYIEESL